MDTVVWTARGDMDIDGWAGIQAAAAAAERGDERNNLNQ